MTTLQEKTASTRQLCISALQSPPLDKIVAAFKQAGIGAPESMNILRSVLSSKKRKDSLFSNLSQVTQHFDLASNANDTVIISRVLLLQSALANLDRLEHLPVVSSVQSMFCDEFKFFAQPSDRGLHWFQPDCYAFEAFSKIALLERFPAGQFDWEVSGFPRSWLPKVLLSDLPRVSHFIATKLKGFAPCFYPHMPIRSPGMLLERECLRAWHRIARSVEMQPHIKGLVVASWYHSPDTFKVSPHLSFMNKPFIESGALITTMGSAPEDSGFLTGSPSRRKLYESGQFKPTYGLILWSRDQMLRWANNHPELSHY
jgi:hypothetical protein